MQNSLPPNLEKQIKKNIYGKSQAIKLIITSGCAAIAFSEIQSILNNLWYRQKIESEISIIENEIYIFPIHLFSIVEILMRSQTISDIRLIIFQGKTFTKGVFEKKCRAISWEYYLNPLMSVKIKVNSISSHIFHENALKKILHDIIKPYVDKIEYIDSSHVTTYLYAELSHDRLTLSISLAGQPLYKRGYRHVLSGSAPLREDAAACFMLKALDFSKKYTNAFSPDTVIIPFSGTGTFAFEWMQIYLKIPPVLFGRLYAIQKMSFFRANHFDFLLKKAKESIIVSAHLKSNIICIDYSEKSNTACLANQNTFNEILIKNGLEENHFTIMKDDFLKMDLHFIDGSLGKFIFMPLNPPYGIRLSKQKNIVQLYKNIANRINELFVLTQKNNNPTNILGFILCPNEETWLSFLNNIKNAKTNTYHFNQGGIDVRVCQFFIGELAKILL